MATVTIEVDGKESVIKTDLNGPNALESIETIKKIVEQILLGN